MPQKKKSPKISPKVTDLAATEKGKDVRGGGSVNATMMDVITDKSKERKER